MMRWIVYVGLCFGLMLGAWNCGGTTINTACQAAGDCAKGETCANGKCTKSCVQDADCPGTMICSQESLCRSIDAEKTPLESIDIDAGPIGDRKGWVCEPGERKQCYSGAEKTEGVGTCQGGWQTCVFGKWGECTGEIVPKEETCDGKDDDCDGQTDEDCKTCTPKVLEKLADGHQNSIRSVKFSPDGKLLATASYDLTIKLWTAEEGKLLKTLFGHKQPIQNIEFTNNGKLLISLDQQRNLILWDIETGKQKYATALQDIYTYTLAINPKQKQFATLGNNIIYLFGHDGALKQTMSIPTTQSVRGVDFSSDGKLLYYAFNTELHIWDIAQKKSLHVFKVDKDPYNKVKSSPDGRWLAVSSYRSVYIYDLKEKKLKYSLSDNSYGLQDMAFSKDGEFLVTVSSSRRITLWSMNTGNQKGYAYQTSEYPYSVDIHPSGAFLATGSSTGTLRTWTMGDIKSKYTIDRVEFWPNNAVAFDPTGKSFATLEEQTIVRLWSMTDKKLLRSFEKSELPIRSMEFSPDGKVLAAILQGKSNEQIFRAWDTETGKPLYTAQKAEGGPLNQLLFHPDGKQIITAAEQHTLDAWDASDGKHTKTYRGHLGPINGVAISKDGKTLISASWDNTIKLWDLDAELPKQTLQGHPAEVNSIAISPDGKRLASGDRLGNIFIWDTTKMALSFKLEGHTDTVTSLAFHPDGKLLLSGSADASLRLWDLGTKKSITALFAHQGAIFKVSFSPDGKSLLSGAGDKTLLWECP